MPICIECSYPVSHLYSTYSRADDRSLGKGVRLTQCPRCKRFADKYVEYDFVVLFIDLVLIKPQVYRHLLFNRLEGDEHKFDRSIIRLGVLLLLFDVYLTWARIEKSLSLDTTFLSRAPIVVQYLFFLSLNAIATLAHHLTVRLLASILAPTPATTSGTANPPDAPVISSDPQTPVIPAFPPAQQQPQSPGPAALSPQRLTPQGSSQYLPTIVNPSANDIHHNPHPTPLAPQGLFSAIPPPLRRVSTTPAQTVQPLPPPSPASPTAISTALFVSSCAKLFPILLVIWGPDGSGSNNNNNNNNTSDTSDGSPGTGTATQTTNLAQRALRRVSATNSATNSGVTGSSLVPTPLLDGLAQIMPAAIPTSYITYFVELMASLFTLEAADTHLVLLSNIEALYILLGCGYMRAMALAVAGLVARWTVQRVILSAVGVG